MDKLLACHAGSLGNPGNPDTTKDFLCHYPLGYPCRMHTLSQSLEIYDLLQ